MPVNTNTLLVRFNLLFKILISRKFKILVGSGTAGSLIASQLNDSVLVLEAGGRSSFLFDIPILQPLLQRSSFDWQYETVPQKKACLGLKQNQSYWPMGKIFGGTHMLNNMIFHKGHETDYKDWFVNFNEEIKERFAEIESEMPVQQSMFRSELAKSFVEACCLLGFDSNFANLTQKNGNRYTFGHNLRKKRNTVLSLHSTVTTLIFDTTDPTKVIGLKFVKNDKSYVAYSKNIILSAGTIGTPKILMLSGIGPKSHLDSLGIIVKSDLPVGENLQDHITTGMDLIILNQTIGLSPSNILSAKSVFNYFLKDGLDSPLSFGGCDALSFYSFENGTPPDISFMVLPVGLTADQGMHLRNIVNLNDNLWHEYFVPLFGQQTVTILPVLLHPKSSGFVKLNSTDYKDNPVINPNYLSSPEDVKTLIKGIRILQSVIDSKPMQRLGAEINPKPLPGCETIEFDSNKYWECYIRHVTLTMYHPVGTCRLGNKKDSHTVVLSDFSVKNTKHLFVVDGSIIPRLPSGNPNAAIALLAQKFISQIKRRKL